MPKTPSRLRALAEERAREDEHVEAVPVPSEVSPVIQELRIHQIELELQNEELRHANVCVERSRARYQSLYDHAPVGYLTLDTEGSIKENNLAAAKLLESASGSLQGRPFSDFIDPAGQDTFYHFQRVQGRNPNPSTTEIRMKSVKGGHRWVRIEGMAAIGAEGESELRLVMSDQTAQKEAEERTHRALAELETACRTQARNMAELAKKSEDLVQEKNRADAATHAKTRFLSSMSHEIRTPMNGVVGMAELLLDTALSNEQRSYVETLQGSARALIGILNDILDISKIEAGKFELEIVPFNLHSLLEDLCSLLGPGAAEKGIDLLLRYAPQAPRAFRGDPGRIRQVVLNLLWNAIKFTEHGHVLLDVSGSPSAEGASVIRIEVKDTGIGIAGAHQARIFQEFEQLDSTPRRNCAGTGLGLSISQALVKRMNGTLGITSQTGKGSTFSFVFPLALDSTPSIQAPPSVPLSRAKAVVVDNHDMRREITLDICSHWGMRVEGWSSWQAFSPPASPPLDAVEGGLFILVDACLLETTPPTFFDWLQTIKAQGTRLWLIAMLGPDGSTRRQELPSRVDALWTYPLREAVVAQTMARLLDGNASPHPPQTAPAPVEAEARPGGKPRLRDRRILVMEDDQVSQQVILAMLGKLDCHADVVSDGIQGCVLAERNTYDLIFTDCHMPEVDGFEAVRRIRRRERTGRRTPVVALTADASKESREDCRTAGMDDFLTKPVSMSGIKDILAKWLGDPRDK